MWGPLQYNIARPFCLKCYNGSVTKIPIAIVHATRASLEPVNRFYAAHAPQLDIYNLLDDGLMRYLDAVDMERADKRFISMLETARDEYGAEMAMLTCSAVPAATMTMLRAWDSSFPVIKIDEPMTAQAVAFGNKIGVLAPFRRRLQQRTDSFLKLPVGGKLNCLLCAFYTPCRPCLMVIAPLTTRWFEPLRWRWLPCTRLMALCWRRFPWHTLPANSALKPGSPWLAVSTHRLPPYCR